jgi:hypothetical protein
MDAAADALWNYSEKPSKQAADAALHLLLAEELRIAINEYIVLIGQPIQSS